MSQKPIRSMTGYARVRKQITLGEIVVAVKSLNHRGLDVRFHLAADIEPLENDMRSRIAKRVSRGHIDVRILFNRTAGADSLGLNRPLFEGYLAAYHQACEEFHLEGALDLATVFRTPGMLTEPLAPELGAEFEAAVMESLEAALDGLNSFREREGAQLAAEIRSRTINILGSAERMEEIRARALPHYQKRLKERLRELLSGSAVEPQRLAQEAAILADRSDIGEELARLKIHTAQLGQMLDAGGEAGKRMDFLLQEMHRETNTILSKTNGIGDVGLEITDLALTTKADIEKIREQALNLE